MDGAAVVEPVWPPVGAEVDGPAVDGPEVVFFTPAQTFGATLSKSVPRTHDFMSMGLPIMAFLMAFMSGNSLLSVWSEDTSQIITPWNFSCFTQLALYVSVHSSSNETYVSLQSEAQRNWPFSSKCQVFLGKPPRISKYERKPPSSVYAPSQPAPLVGSPRLVASVVSFCVRP